MRESEHKYRQLFENLGDAAFLIDVETGRVIDTNQQAEKLLGRERAEILGRNHRTFFPPDKAEEFGRRVMEPDTGTAIGFEAEVQAANRRDVSVHLSVAPFTLFGRRPRATALPCASVVIVKLCAPLAKVAPAPWFGSRNVTAAPATGRRFSSST